jgi:hypothetical protein
MELTLLMMQVGTAVGTSEDKVIFERGSRIYSEFQNQKFRLLMAAKYF